MVLAGALVRVWHVSYGLPDLFHPDEPRIVTRAVRFHGGDLDPHFFNWPSLSMYLLSVVYGAIFGIFDPGGVVAAFARDPVPFYVVGRLVTTAFGSATIAVLYVLAAESHGRPVALVASTILALDLLHVHDSQFATTDVPLAFLVTATMLLILRYQRRGRGRDALLSGVLAGLAASMKYPGGLMLLPLVVAHLSCPPARQTWWRRLLDRNLLLAGLAALAGFLVGTPFALLTPRAFARGVLDEIGQVRAVQFGNEGDLPGYLFHLGHSLPEAMGLPLALLALVGLVQAVAGWGARDRVLLAFPIAYFLVIGSWSSRFERYAIPLLPFTALLAAAALETGVRRFSAYPRVARRIPPGLALASAAVLLLAPEAARLAAFHRLLGRADTRAVASAWIEREVPAGSRIALEPYSPSLPVAPGSRLGAPPGVDEESPTVPVGRDGAGDPAGAGGYRIARLDQYDLAGLFRSGVEYVVLSGFVYQRHQRACDRHPAPCRFYQELERRATRVLTVESGVDDGPLWVGDIYSPLTRLRARVRPGPTIRVYRLSTGPPA